MKAKTRTKPKMRKITPTKPKMRKITLELPLEMLTDIDRQAKAMTRDRSKQIRVIIAKHFMTDQ